MIRGSGGAGIHSGKRYRIKTRGNSNRSGVRVQTYNDVIERYANHPESKSADSEGNPSNSGTIGLLGRLNVQVLTISHIGKETNLIEQQEEGILDFDPQGVYSGGGEWELVRSWLDRVSIPRLAAESGISERTLRHWRRGDRRPLAKTIRAITETLSRMLNDRSIDAR